MVELIHTHKGTVYAQRNGVLIPVNTDGLVGYWPMTEGSGGTAYDESKTGNDGTLNNGPVWTDTANGKALSFDGVDDYVDVLDDPSLSVGKITISTWVNLNNFNDQFWLNHKEGNGDYYEQVIYGGTLGEFVVYISGSWYGAGVTASSYLSTGTWHHIINTYDGSTVKTYVDDSEVASNTINAGELSSTVSSLYIGGDIRAGKRYVDGTIDEVRVYDRALSAQEITNTYEKTRGLYNV